MSLTNRQRGRELTGGIILNETLTEILLVRGTRSKKLGLPKGHIEDKESYLKGALREIWEETGLKIELAVNILPCILTLRAKLYLITVRKDKCKLSIKDTNEIEDVGWYPISSLDELEESTMMLKDLRDRMPHVLDKIRSNITNYDLHSKGKRSEKIYLNEFLYKFIIQHINKSTDDIVEIVKRKYSKLFYQPDLKLAIQSIKNNEIRGLDLLCGRSNWTIAIGKNVVVPSIIQKSLSLIA